MNDLGTESFVKSCGFAMEESYLLQVSANFITV